MSYEKIWKPTDLTTIDILENFDYFLNQSFLWLISDITKDYIGVERPKNRKEALIWFWITIKLRHFLAKIFPHHNIRVAPKERVVGLLDSVFYDIVIHYNEIPILVIDTYFMFSNINRNFPRLMKNLVFNATNVNQHDGMEYLPLFIFPEESPVFLAEDSRVLEKMEEFSSFQLAKLYNFSLCPHNMVEITTLLLTPYIDWDSSKKKNSLKVKSPKFSQGKIFNMQALKDGDSMDSINRIVNHCLAPNEIEFLKLIIVKIRARLKRMDRHGIQNMNY